MNNARYTQNLTLQTHNNMSMKYYKTRPIKMTPVSARDQRLARAKQQQNVARALGRIPQRMEIVQMRPNNQIYGRGGDELKGVDTLMPTGAISTTNTNGTTVVCNLVQQGAGSWNRIGKRIRMKSIRYKGIIDFSCIATATNLTNNTCRIVLVYDKQPSGGAIPTFDQIFGNTDQAGTETSNFLDNVRVDNTSRFNVLKDDVIDSDFSSVPTAAGGVNWQKCIDIFVPLKGLETVFSGQSAPMTIADISTGALYLITRAELAVAGSNIVTIQNSAVKLRYYD